MRSKANVYKINALLYLRNMFVYSTLPHQPLMTNSGWQWGNKGRDRGDEEPEKNKKGLGKEKSEKLKKNPPELKKQKQQSWAHQQRFHISCQNVARSALQLLLSAVPSPHTSPTSPPRLHKQAEHYFNIWETSRVYAGQESAGLRSGSHAQLRCIGCVDISAARTNPHRCQGHLTRRAAQASHSDTAFHSATQSWAARSG